MYDGSFTFDIFTLDSSLLLDYIRYETQFYPHFLTTSDSEKIPLFSPKSRNPSPDPINPAILLLKHLRIPCCKEQSARTIFPVVVFG